MGECSTPGPGYFTSRKRKRHPLYRRLCGSHEQSGLVRETLPPQGVDPGIFQPVASRYIDYAITGLRNLFGNVNSCLSSADKKNQLDVTFCVLYFSSKSCSTCFGQPCAHHQVARNMLNNY